ncbi:MAG: hypothetical protein EOL97_02245 [Spirochaetia bacterium]|nr:hypothetical protein [Spirochaetia bacterium]
MATNIKYSTFKENQQTICKILTKSDSEKNFREFLIDRIHPNITFGFNSKGQTKYKLINNDKKAHLLPLNNQELFKPIIEINLILTKLAQNGIIYFWDDFDANGLNYIFVQLQKEPISHKSAATSIKSILIYSILSKQYYVNQEKLNRFIKHGYKTENEIKESRDNKLYVIAIIAILVPIITTIIQIKYK